jgi:outer membrane receptor protein involved in Fe transport
LAQTVGVGGTVRDSSVAVIANASDGRKRTRNLEVFAAAENLTDERYNVANTPTARLLFNIGPPLL